jgi:protein involved in polysaccharide export with SLBB domain
MRLTPAVGLLISLIIALPSNTRAQVPTQLPMQIPGLRAGMSADEITQLLKDNPQLVLLLRQRIQQSGLSPDEIRTQLAAAGYPSNLLDAYLGSSPGGSMLSSLGLPSSLESESTRPDTGVVRTSGEAVRPESLAAGNYVFGVDVFRRTTTQFLPLLTGPVDPSYRLGPGDVIVVLLTGGVEQTYQLDVTRGGYVLVPQVGQVYVNNLTLDNARAVLLDRLTRVYSRLRGPNPTIRFDATVARVRVNQIYVVGEVAQPGSYQISALGTAFTALYAAGGVTARANMRQIEIRHGGTDKAGVTLDLYDYLLRGDKRDDIRLESGDVVYVPLHGTRAQITGAVLRPAVYELKEGETLPDLLRAAGGFRANAAVDRLAIHRILPPAERKGLPRVTLDVELPPERHIATVSPTAATNADVDPLGGVVIPSLPLANGDSVVVDSILPRDSLPYVGINGLVNKPGHYPWQPGMTLTDLMRLARGPKIGAYLKDVEIARLPAERAPGRLADTLRAAVDSTAAVPLQPFDEVLVLKQPDFELQRTVQIRGEVKFPGTYALRSKDERLMDLLDRAGGLTPQAYANGIRFYRREGDAGRVGLDLPRVLKNRKDKDNILLANGDSLYVPAYLPTVRVQGAVNSPGSVTYVHGQGLDYYLSAAGGVAVKGDKHRVFVQQPNGNVSAVHKRPLFFGTSKPTPEAGALVVVPVRDTTAQSQTGATLSGIAQIVAALTTIVVVYVTRH